MGGIRLVGGKRAVSTGGRSMRMIVLKPRKQAGRLPGILWIHGGGYMLGNASMVYFSRGKDLAKALGAVVVSPEYRLARVKPYPAALEDCYAALRYMYQHAGELGIDPRLLIVGGESAGGGLAAALCIYARDRGEIPIAYQVPLYPMIDCEDTESSRNNHAHIWNTRRNHLGWRKYLAGLEQGEPVPAYASPSRQSDYTRLPPAYTFVCDGEPFYTETVEYIRRLREAGIQADVDVYHANTHAFDMMCPWLKVSRQARKRLLEVVCGEIAPRMEGAHESSQGGKPCNTRS